MITIYLFIFRYNVTILAYGCVEAFISNSSTPFLKLVIYSAGQDYHNAGQDYYTIYLLFTFFFSRPLLISQTGSGKTYSMGTALDSNIPSEHQGKLHLHIPRHLYHCPLHRTRKGSTLQYN